MKITGGCHCGAISFQAEIDPERVILCHCTDCQTLSGSAFRVVAPTSDFRLLAGKPKTYLKTGESGRKRTQAFCADCGAPIYSADATNSPPFTVRIGAVDQRAELPPQIQIWCRSALGWAMHIEPIPQIANQDSDRPAR